MKRQSIAARYKAGEDRIALAWEVAAAPMASGGCRRICVHEFKAGLAKVDAALRRGLKTRAKRRKR